MKTPTKDFAGSQLITICIEHLFSLELHKNLCEVITNCWISFKKLAAVLATKANKYKEERKQTRIMEKDNGTVLLQCFLVTEQNAWNLTVLSVLSRFSWLKYLVLLNSFHFLAPADAWGGED